MRRASPFVLAALLTLGCAENAFLELQLRLPPAPAGESWFAYTQARSAADFTFAGLWGGGRDPAVVPLTDEQAWTCTSVEATDESVDLNVRVRFCRSENCLDLMLGDGFAPEALYAIEHPFYIGRRTYARFEVDRIPNCSTSSDCAVGICTDEGRCGCETDADCTTLPNHVCDPLGCVEEVDRCDVSGCIDNPGGGTFCSGSGEHFCETLPDLDLPVACDPP